MEERQFGLLLNMLSLFFRTQSVQARQALAAEWTALPASERAQWLRQLARGLTGLARTMPLAAEVAR